MADVDVSNIEGGPALPGLAMTGVAAAVDQEQTLRRFDQHVGLIVFERKRRSCTQEDQSHAWWLPLLAPYPKLPGRQLESSFEALRPLACQEEGYSAFTITWPSMISGRLGNSDAKFSLI